MGSMLPYMAAPWILWDRELAQLDLISKIWQSLELPAFPPSKHCPSRPLCRWHRHGQTNPNPKPPRSISHQYLDKTANGADGSCQLLKKQWGNIATNINDGSWRWWICSWWWWFSKWCWQILPGVEKSGQVWLKLGHPKKRKENIHAFEDSKQQNHKILM